MIERLDYELSKTEFMGDAFPYLSMDCFGPSCVSGFCGAKLQNSTGNVWFTPEKSLEISDIHVKYDPENVCVQRIKSLYRAGQERWGSNVLMAMPDLGGIQDIAAIFANTNNLLAALIEEPEEVIRLQSEIYQALWEAYGDLNSVLQPVNPGYSDWGGLYSQTPSYIIQDDFAFMISPEMYEEFAFDDVRRQCQNLSHTIYHLDGPGNLRHLDLLLQIPELSAIQWVPGAGQPSAANWMDTYDKIYKAGKGIEVIGDLDDFAAVCEKYGDRVAYHLTVDDASDTTRHGMNAKDCLNDYHVVHRGQLGEVENLLSRYHCR